jgi:phosphoribosylformylglycinamidine cyclo-ligase
MPVARAASLASTACETRGALAQSGYQAQLAGYLTAEAGVTLRVEAGELKYA